MPPSMMRRRSPTGSFVSDSWKMGGGGWRLWRLAVAAALRPVARRAALPEHAVAAGRLGGERVVPEGVLQGVLRGRRRAATPGDEDQQDDGHLHRECGIPRRPTRPERLEMTAGHRPFAFRAGRLST